MADAPTFPFAPGTAVQGGPPRGYRLLERRRVLGRGSADLERYGRAVLGWQLQRGSGIAVTRRGRDAPDVAAGLEVRLHVPLLRTSPRPGRGLVLQLVAPARVTAVLVEPRRIGFAYGTLPGHPERGEEAFLVGLRDDGGVELTIRAISRPAMPYGLLPPLAALYQRAYLARYLAAAAPPS